MSPFIDQAPKRIWLHGVGDPIGETTWAEDPSPSGQAVEAEHAIEYVRRDVADGEHQLADDRQHAPAHVPAPRTATSRETTLEEAIRFGEDAFARIGNRIDRYAGIHPDMLRRLIDAAKAQARAIS